MGGVRVGKLKQLVNKCRQCLLKSQWMERRALRTRRGCLNISATDSKKKQKKTKKKKKKHGRRPSRDDGAPPLSPVGLVGHRRIHRDGD